ncbi:MAG TPA: TRAP transporter fused permease subunit [Gemmatimonadaceae bacterium]|nr:TRAP transporter fused permease subunit [Gemmatimonadaceae bacterium]
MANGARTLLATALALFAIYATVFVVDPLFYRASFLLVALVLTFVLYPARAKGTRGSKTDVALAVLAVVALGWPIIDIASFPYRAAVPTWTDLTLGTLAILLILEATRRTVGWILPATALAFILYAYLGPLFDLVGLDAIAHRGYYIDRLIGTMYMTLDGVFGTPLDVAATYIILFSIFGAVLEHTGAGKFFIDWALALMRGGRSGAAAGRAVTLAGFLLGTVSGSGVATTVTLGSVSWPLLKRSGYPPEVGGAVLSAAGIGAILSPPTMGAAAFLIAEFLKIPFFDVLLMSIVPALLYYLSAFMMVEFDARRLGTRAVEAETKSAATLAAAGWFYFLPLVAIVAFMALGFTPFRAVLWATVLAALASYLDRANALTPSRAAQALASGARATLPVAATTATAGIIVGMVTLTGLGLRVSGIVVDVAGGNVALTVLFAAIAVWMLGLAVPVTASYIIAAVMVAPALTSVGIPDVAAHMFIFYYAVLSEVTPPTALSPFAAAAITGGNPYRTMMLTWKYALPAFVVPFVFTLLPGGTGILLKAPATDVLWSTSVAAGIVVAAAFALGARRAPSGEN